MNRMILSVISGLLSVILLSSCASSKRMSRMSGGMFGDSLLPEYEYIDGSRQILPSKMIERRKYEMTAGIDDSIINIWPFFYRNRNYFSFVWPLIDYDRFGFAVRPFFNKEGNEYSVLFPLSGWNSARADGWVLNSYWSEKGVGSVPLFHIPWDYSNNVFYFLLCWKKKANYGIFPLVWGKGGENGYFNIVPLLFHDKEKSMVPFLFYYSDVLKQFLLFYYHKDGDYGIFPLVHHSSRLINFIFPVYWHDYFFGTACPFTYFNRKSGDWIVAPFWKLKDSFGMFPVFFQKSDGTEGLFFPLYFYDSKLILTLLGGWGKKADGSSFATVLGPLFIQNKENSGNKRVYFRTGCKDFPEQLVRKSRTFRMYGLLGYSDFGVGLRFRDNLIRELYTLLNTDNEETELFRDQSALNRQLKTIKWKNPQLSGLPDSIPQDKEKRMELARRLEEEAEKIELKKYGIFPLFQLEQNRPVKLSEKKEFFSFDLGPFGMLSQYLSNNNQFRFSILGPLGYSYEEEKSGKSWKVFLLFRREKNKSENSFWSPLFSFSQEWRNTEKWKEGRLFNKYQRNWENRTVHSLLAGLLYREKKWFYPSFRDYTVTKEYLKRSVRFSNPLISLYDTVRKRNDRIDKNKIAFDERLERSILLFFNYDRRSSLKYDWHLAWLLARGSRDGDRRQIRILEWIYRSNKESDRENTLIFPFISIQKEKERESYSFLWRLFRLEYRNDKLTGGNLFFIPF